MNELDTRYQLSLLLMFDYKSLEDNLAMMASKGWKIDYLGLFLRRFKKTKPSHRKFFVDFSSDALEYNPKYVEMDKPIMELCNENGWKKEIQWKQMQIFSADVEAVQLEIDEAVRIESVCRVMNKTFIPSWIIGFFGMLMLTFSNAIEYFGDSSYWDENTGWVSLIELYVALILGVALLGYFLWLKVSRKKISKGGSGSSAVWYRRLLNVLLIGFLAIVVGYFVYL